MVDGLSNVYDFTCNVRVCTENKTLETRVESTDSGNKSSNVLINQFCELNNMIKAKSGAKGNSIMS